MAIPTELFRFRIVRGIQAQQVRDGAAIDLVNVLDGAGRGDGPPGGGDGPGGDYPEMVGPDQPGGEPTDPDIDPRTWTHWLNALSTALAVPGDAVDPSAVVALLPADWRDEVASADWDTIKTDLTRSLSDAMGQIGSEPGDDVVAVVEGLSRLLQVQDLVSVLLADEQRDPADRTLQTALDVKAALTYKIVILPKEQFGRGEFARRLIRQPGVTDLYLVKDEWNRYEAGELARVVNVLPGETFDSRLKHFEETETTSSQTTQTTTTQETENSQTQTSSLSQSTTKDASLNVGVNGQVEVSGQYGPTHVQSSLTAQLQSSQSESDTRAYTTSTQTVQRSVKEISQTVIDVQTRRTLVGDVSTEDHKLANDGSDTVVGLYRWLSEVHRCQVERYPNRFVLEFEIPEPGAWLRWAMTSFPVPLDNPDPGPFRITGRATDISPTDLDNMTIAQISSQWRLQGIDTLPPDQMTVSVEVNVDPNTQNNARFATASDNSMQVPNGYQAVSWSAEVFSTRNWSLPTYGTELTVTVGGDPSAQASTGDMGQAAFVQQALQGTVGPINTGTIPVAAYSIALQGFTCVINILCTLMPETKRQLQQQAFDEIAAGYQSLLVAHQQELAASALKPGSLAGLVGPPDLNRARAVAELRRLVVESLTATTFNGEPAVTVDPATGEPNVDLGQAAVTGPVVQFFEQAFEWENIVYVPYPYYWGRRSTWPQSALSATADPEFDTFLNSGSARVVVPARPGFEDIVSFYLYTGIVWGGTRPPAPNDPDYLSIAQEIQAIQVGAVDGTPVGSSWEISLPTTLLWAGDDPATLPTNPNPTIPAPQATTTYSA